MSDAKFKQTEIGLIPEGWECVRFGDIIDFLPNNTLSRECLSNEGTVKNIHYGDVLINYGDVLDASSPTIPCIDNEKLGSYKPRRIAQDGDIIIADTAEDETVCKATELWNVGQNKVVSGLHTTWCRPKKGLFASKYLGYFVNSSIYHNQVLPFIQGIKVSSVSKKDIKETWLLVPPIVEQERIASALSAVDELLASLDKQIAKTRDIKQGVMQQLTTTQRHRRPHVLLREVAKIIRGIRVTKSKLACNGTYPVVSGGTGYMGYINEYNREPETITIAQYGTAGYVGWQAQRFWANDVCFSVVPNIKLIANKFLYYLLESKQEYLYSISNRDATPFSIDREKILSISIPIPPREEQKYIADVLTSLDNTIEGLEAKRQKYESVKAGMMQQLLTGAIRLN